MTGSMRFCRGSDAVRSSWGTESCTTVAMFRVIARSFEDGVRRVRVEAVDRRCMNIASMSSSTWGL